MFKCVISLLEIKYFVSLKIESSHFWTRVHFKGGAKSSKILRDFAHKGGSDRFRIFWVG